MSTLADTMLAWKVKLTTKMTSEQVIETIPERETCYLISAPQYGEGCQECSVCGEVLDGYLFDEGHCPNCGAKVVN